MGGTPTEEVCKSRNVRLPKLPVLSVLGLLMCLPVAGADALMETAQQEAATAEKAFLFGLDGVYVERPAATA